MAASFGIEADFDCSLEQLWTFVSHVPNQDRWVFGMSDSEVVEGSEVKRRSVIEGTSTERGKSLRITIHVEEFNPPNRIVWRNDDGHTPFRTEILCSGDDAASHMRYRVTLFPTAMLMRIAMGPLRPLGAIVANRMLREEIDHLREALKEAA